MKLFLILTSILVFAVILIFLTAFVCFSMAFHVSGKKSSPTEEFDIPKGEIYEPYRDIMVKWMKETRAMKSKDVFIQSFDGLTLHGKYYEYAPGAPVELMFHGYRGTAERDLGGGVQRCFSLGRNVLIVDQRGSCLSQGNVITFGINESRDCLSWIDFLISDLGSDVKIILTGISMGASTVMMATGRSLPPNVVMVLADCGYTSAQDIIKKVIDDMKLPSSLLYPFVKLGARIFGHFDLEEISPLEAMKRCTVPVIFIHGEADDFVPCEMSRRNYEACIAPKKLLTVPGAGHGLGYLTDNEAYFRELVLFSNQIGLPTSFTSSHLAVENTP